MLRKSVLVLAMVVCELQFATGETIELKDQAAVAGKILAEKHDEVVVDVGYTVLVIPRKQISKIVRTSPEVSADPVLAKAPPAVPPLVEADSGFYQAPALPGPASNVRDLVKRIGEAVVQVRTPSGLGSGFIINEEGYLITNFHVIEGETQISVEVYLQRNGQLELKDYKRVRIIAINKFGDMALLKIEDPGTPRFKSVTLGSSDVLAVGEHVFAIGSPLGLERTVTEGILSTKTREMQGALYLQTTAQINPGNSGGPLFNMSGEVIGITNMKITFGEGLGFAIPVEAVKYFLNHRDAYAYSTDNPSNPYRYLEPPSHARQSRDVE